MQLNKFTAKQKINRSILLSIIADCLDLTPEKLAIDFNKIVISDTQENKIKGIILKYLKGVPLAYCLEKKFFYKDYFYVNKNTLIPRPESEILVERAIKIINGKKHRNIIDIGTGCGNIIISINKYTSSKSNYYGVDISKKALAIALKNSQSLNAKQIVFYRSNLLSNKSLPKKFDLILANLPYLKSNYLHNLPKSLANSLAHEPSIALDGGDDGLYQIKKLIKTLNARLADDGACIIEIDHKQTRQILKECKNYNLKAEIIKDLNNFNRFIEIRKLTRQA